jgi:hypothetical protein
VDFYGAGCGSMDRFCEHANENWAAIQGRKFQFARFEVLTLLLLEWDTVPIVKQLPTFRRNFLLYIQFTGSLGRLLLSVGKNSSIVVSGFCREIDESCALLG